MSSRIRAIAAVLVTSLLAVGTVRYTRAQAMPPSKQTRHKLSFEYVAEKASLARSDDPQAIRAFTDEIFNRSLFSGAPPSLRDRISRAEAAFRQGKHPSISEGELVDVVSRHVEMYGAPSFAKTSVGQVHASRQVIRKWVPDFAGKHTSSISSDMSPAEAVSLILHLGMQKLTNPQFQVEPEQWESDDRARIARSKTQLKAEPTRSPTTGSITVVSKALSGLYLQVRHANTGDESSEIVRGAHAFLDELGFAR